MRLKQIISSVLIVIVSIMMMSVFTEEAHAKDKVIIPYVKQDVFIYDEDNILNDNVEYTLNKMLVDLERKTDVEFAVITTQSLNGLSIESYANTLFNKLGIGKADKDNGILLLVSRNDTRVRLEIGRGLEGCLTDGVCGRILDDYFVPYRENDNYDDAINYTVQAVMTLMAKEYNVTFEGMTKTLEVADSKQIAEEETKAIIIAIVVIIGIFILLFILHCASGGDPGDFFIDFFSGSGGGSSGGGFGGGFSGGGGASR